jgi:hypothetical protein
MKVSRAMRRLERVRKMEEEQCQSALESTLGNLRWLEAELEAARERERGGRRWVTFSAAKGDLADRVAGLEESRSARQRAASLAPKIRDAQQRVALRRQEFLAKRVERRQVEALIKKAEEQDAIEASRHTQRALDDWFLDKTR